MNEQQNPRGGEPRTPKQAESTGKPLDRRTAERRQPRDKQSGGRLYHNLLLPCLFILFFLYMENVLHISLYKSYDGKFFAYSTLFSMGGALICSLLCSVFSEKTNRIMTLVLMGFVTLYFGVQLVYFRFFKDYFYWDLLSVAGDALKDFWRETLRAIGSSLFYILLLILPFVLYCIFGKRIVRTLPMSWAVRIPAAVCAFFLLLGASKYVAFHDDLFDDRYYYKEGFAMAESVSRFGLLPSLRLDTHYTLFGRPSGSDVPVVPGGNDTAPSWSDLFVTDPPLTPGTDAPERTGAPGTDVGGEPVTDPVTEPVPVETDPPAPPVDRSPNVLDIDFEKLLSKASATAEKNAHTWFMNRTPTNKGEYTGMFKGKNLIFITVEAWAPAAINEQMTPTLWKMKNEGFVFENYFCSNWGGSTATGEYANITGNFYGLQSCLKTSSKTLEPFVLGNMLKAQGYVTYAFHNHTYTYYDRNLSHPNFGYKWLAIGNWDKSNLFRNVWPRSDKELADNTLSYIPTDGTPFHFYYMTVSGHANQTFTGSSQSYKHKSEVYAAGLPYTDVNALSYIAAQYEVELMVSSLCDYLEEKGLLEDTVFVMAPDHYPYVINDASDAINKAALADLYGLPADGLYTNYELYRAPLVLWSASMKEPVHVSKVCSAIDILPTVLNLFGLDYDSRLIMGHDILSDTEGFVILNMSNAGGVSSSNNWITDYGIYSSGSKKFTPFPGVTVDTAQLTSYISYHTNLLAQMRTYSSYILEKDYYRKVFN